MNMVEAREAMVDNQIRPADVIDYQILGAFLRTKREQFVPENAKTKAYGEYEIPLCEGRAMMTPRSFAKLVQMANPRPHEEILVIGSGLGYEAAILAQLSATVIALESQSALLKESEKSLAKEGFDNAISIKGSLTKGEEKAAPFDIIFFNGAIGEFPQKLAAQLKDNGRVAAIFEDQGVYTAKMLFKSGDDLIERSYFQAAAPILPGFAKKAEFQF